MSQMEGKWIETERETLVTLTHSMYGRTVISSNFPVHNVLHHISLIEQSLKIGCTSVHQLYRMRMHGHQMD